MCFFKPKHIRRNYGNAKRQTFKRGFFYIKKAEELDVFENFYQKLSSISIQYINTGQKTKLCFIDERLQKVPFFSNIKTRPFLINSVCDYDNLINGLEKINFIQKDFPFDTPGSFYINGGVVDIKPFDTKENYRISFLESDCKIYTVNKDTNTIVAQVQRLRFFQKALKKQFLLSACSKKPHSFKIQPRLSLFRQKTA